jgi:tight adherence protein C
MTSLLAAAFTSLSIAALVWAVLDPPVGLERRVQPYLAHNRAVQLWRSVGRGRVDPRTALGSLLSTAAERVGDVIDGQSREHLVRRLRQARLFQESDDPAATYRIRQFASVMGGTLGVGMTGGMLGMTGGQVAGMCVLGLVVGATRQRGRLDEAIEERRRVMAMEIYTVNQVLAIRVRAGGGAVHAVSRLVERGSGEVVDELREALRLHRAGMSTGDAFRRAAAETPEPSCARTYAFLALSDERGADLAEALLALAEDVREARREEIRRSATRRRAAMLIPTVAVLAPVMLLFVGAPLPSLVLGFS